MSEFSRNIAATTAAFAVCVGSLAVARDMKAEYNQDKLNCHNQPSQDLIEQCEQGYGMDNSDILEILGFGALVVTVVGGFRTVGSINDSGRSGKGAAK